MAATVWFATHALLSQQVCHLPSGEYANVCSNSSHALLHWNTVTIEATQTKICATYRRSSIVTCCYMSNKMALLLHGQQITPSLTPGTATLVLSCLRILNHIWPFLNQTTSSTFVGRQLNNMRVTSSSAVHTHTHIHTHTHTHTHTHSGGTTTENLENKSNSNYRYC